MFSRLVWAIIGGVVVGGVVLLALRVPQRVAARSYATQATEAWKNGDAERAKLLVQNTLRLNPEHAASYELLGAIALVEKDLSKAFEYYEKALAISPRSIKAAKSLADLYASGGDLEKGRQIMDAEIVLYPRRPDLPLFAGFLTLSRDPDTALVYFQRALSIAPNAPEIHAAIGSVYFIQQDYNQALGSYQESLRLADAASTRASIGACLYYLGRLDEAAAELQRAIGMDPQLAEPYASLGFVYQKLGKMDDARKMFSKYLALIPPGFSNTRQAEDVRSQLESLGGTES